MNITYEELGDIGRFCVGEIDFNEGLEEAKSLSYKKVKFKGETKLDFYRHGCYMEGIEQGFYEMLIILSAQHLR